MDSKAPLVLKTVGRDPDPDLLKPALRALGAGRLVVLPTETVYGLAADPRSREAMAALYRAKDRPEDKPIALLAASAAQFEEAGITLSGRARRLAQRYWPGPLTIVLPGPEGFVGCRVPNHPVTHALLVSFGRPLAVTSANLSGTPPALTAEDARVVLGHAVAVIVDSGDAEGKVPSTVIKVVGEDVHVLREGSIPSSEILAC